MATSLGLAAVAALILANAFFVAAEFAFVAVRRGRLEDRAAEGDARARRAVDVSKRLSFVLSGAQLGITVTSLLLGFIAEPTVGRLLVPLFQLVGLPEQAAFGVAFTAAFVLATAAQMVFGELAPKNLAIARPEQFALGLARPTWWFTRVAGPVIQLFDRSSNGLLRALGVEPVQELAGGVSPEELELIIEESGREGALTAAQAALLRRGLEFRTLRAGDAMVPRTQIAWVDSEATCEQLRRLALETGYSRFPVVGQGLDDVRGIAQAKDILRVHPAVRGRTPVRNVLRPALAVPESALLGPLLADMREAHRQLAIVVDEYGGTAGIVTLEDIVEELVGAIQDEYDPSEPRVQQLSDGSYAVPGAWRLDEAERETGVALPEGDYDTIGGLVMQQLGRVPQEGDVVRLDNAVVRVEVMDGLAVARVHLAPTGREDTEVRR